MSDEHHPVDELLRRYAAAPRPTAADRRRAEEALNRVVTHAATRSPRRRVRVGVVATALIVIALGITVVLQTIQPTAAAAALNRIARVAAATDPLTIPGGQYAYTSSDILVLGVVPAEALTDRDRPLAYLLPQDRHTWIGDRGVVQIRTTTQSPVFFTAQDEADYYGAGLDRIDGVGLTVTETVTGATSILDDREWPTEPGQLLQAMEASFPPERGIPYEAEVIDVALALLRETAAPPPLRAAVLHVIAGLDLQVTQQHPDGATSFALSYATPQATVITFTLTARGELVEETTTLLDGDPALNIPPATTIHHATYTLPIIVPDLDTP